MLKKLKIAVIGAGPSGSFSAYLLKSLGHEVHLFEQRTEIRRRLCGEYLAPSGTKILSEYKLKDKILHGFSPIKGMILVDCKNQNSIKAEFPHEGKTFEGVSVNRLQFDQSLIDLAIDSGVNVHYGYKLTALKRIDHYWSLTFNEQDQQSFDLLIAADGRYSYIGKLLSHSANAKADRIALHCYIPRKSDLGLRFGEMHIFQDGSYCGLNPISDEEVNFSIVLDTKEIQNNKNLKNIINDRIRKSKRLSELFDPINDETVIKSISPLTHLNNFVAGENMAYVGDAAGFIDPLTGEGITNALLSADLLFKAFKEANSIEEALKIYKMKKKKSGLQKLILNTLFQKVIRTPWLVTLIAKLLRSNKKRADIFIGIIGNIFTPSEGFKKMLQPTFD